MQCANHIRQLRLDRGLTQQDLAISADLSISYIKRLEDGDSTPTVPVARALAESLGVTVDELFPVDRPAAVNES